MVSTGQVGMRTTFSVTEPNTNRFQPLRPCVAITMRSIPFSFW
jgi:hypothetical protein